MILLDKHVWLWWVQDPGRIRESARRRIEAEEKRNGLLVSAVSFWEISLKVSIGKLHLPMDVKEWLEAARGYPGIRAIPLSPEAAVESTQLPGAFHNDPADRFLVAQARIREVPLATADGKILPYPFVETIKC